ncbi:MAG: hypothetical protein OWT28_12075 [Firmicutes bacterium]|nr:hypothetical protein [Bacillota bacterium]
MNANRLAAHETLELHELLASTTTSYTVCQSLRNSVTDPQLGNFIDQQGQVCQRHMQELQQLLSRSAFH